MKVIKLLHTILSFMKTSNIIYVSYNIDETEGDTSWKTQNDGVENW